LFQTFLQRAVSLKRRLEYRFLKALSLGLISMLFSVEALAQAGTIPWRGPAIYEVMSETKNVKDLLRGLAGAYGITAVIDEEISASPIQLGSKFKLPPQQFLDFLVNTNGLIWFYDGSLLHVERATQAQTEVIRLTNASERKIRKALQQLGLLDQKPPLSCSVNAGIVRVSGPRAYIRIVKDTVKALDTAGVALRDSETRYFKLKYASAVDVTFEWAGKTMRIPGIAQVLSSLMSTGEAPAGSSGAEMDSTDTTLVPLKPYQPKGLPIASPGFEENMVQSTIRVQKEYAERSRASTARSGSSTAQIVAEPRTNTIIVRDSPERLGLYEDLIRMLDTRPIALEIEASIIEVASDELETLGVDWRFGNRRLAVESGPTLGRYGDNIDALAGGESPRLVPPIAAAALNPGGTLTTILGGGARYFIARVRALAEQGKASVISKPRVVTLDNLASVIQYNSTFYVPVSGAYASNLFDVTVGLALKVTPRVVPGEGDAQQIQLVVQIEDGSITDTKVGQLPVVTRANITTQTFVKDGDSLLIAGFTQEKLASSRSGIPVLSKIPLIGGLFRTDSKSQSRVERMFLLTPRIIPSDLITTR
jgi:type III secretion protein C